jgi:hypothetical protein
MVLRGVTHGFRDAERKMVPALRRQPWEVDLALRTTCAKIIADHSHEFARLYEAHSITRSIARLCEVRQVHVVDFNFDVLVGGDLGMATKSSFSDRRPPRSSGLTRAEYSALRRNWLIHGGHDSRL